MYMFYEMISVKRWFQASVPLFLGYGKSRPADSETGPQPFITSYGQNIHRQKRL